jgi:hypothetical protein
MTTRLVVCAVVLSCLAAGCGKSSPSAPSSSAQGVNVTGTSNLTAVGQTAQLAATANMSTGETTSVTSQATWLSDNTNVATVSSTGLLTAVGGGQATISATYRGLSGTLRVSVVLSIALVSTSYAEDRFSTDPMTISNISAQSNQLLVVFVASDGPRDRAQTISNLSGGGLSWNLAVRANAQPGDAEIWYAIATSGVTGITITASRSSENCNTGVCNGLLGVAVFSGVNLARPVGANAARSQATGTPAVSLTTTRDQSWVFGVGADWDQAATRVIGAGQTMGHDDQSTQNGDDYWVQYMTSPTPASGTLVTLDDLAPANHIYNFASVEICVAGS